MPLGRGRMGRPGLIDGGIGRRDDRGDRREDEEATAVIGARTEEATADRDAVAGAQDS